MLKRTFKKPKIQNYSTIPHPNGIKPLGNCFLDDKKPIRKSGLGNFSLFSDEFILDFLTDLQDDSVLCSLAMVSKAFYCFLYTDEIWRDKMKKIGRLDKFIVNWRTTYIHHKTKNAPTQTYLNIPNMFSDRLFSSWRCATVPLHDLCGVEIDNIIRVNSLTNHEFQTIYSKKPFILTDVAKDWPAIKKWDMDFFINHSKDRIYKAEAFDVTFESYASYARQCCEESPLYLFDPGFAKNTTLEMDYTVPEIFRDFFDLLVDDRPNFQWLIVGPKRSGSTFHIDPNGTSAWNAVIKGSKKWILYPPTCPPPGVFPSSDGSEVTSPVSLMEWYLHYYDQVAMGDIRPIECVCNAGEIIFVPSGWWHCVSCQISGVKSAEGLYKRFTDVLSSKQPGLLESIEIEAEKERKIKDSQAWPQEASFEFTF